MRGADAPSHVTGLANWTPIWFRAGDEVRGPLWEAIKAMAAVMLDPDRNRFSYDDLAAIAGPLIPDSLT
jgi:hypothetical protein